MFFQMERWAGRTALVTGASVGIGRAICKNLLALKVNVVACARRLEAVQAIAAEVPGCEEQFLPLKCDVSKEEDILRMFEQIKASKFKGVDICINNAGLGNKGSLCDGDTDVWRNMLNVNVLGLSICTREAIKSMKERGVDDGHVIHISSVVAHTVVTSVPFYSATKFAVRALAEGLRQELAAQNSKIRVSQISPGLVRTEFAEVLTNKEAATAFYDSSNYLTAEDVTAAVIHVLGAPLHVQTHEVLLRPVGQPSL